MAKASSKGITISTHAPHELLVLLQQHSCVQADDTLYIGLGSIILSLYARLHHPLWRHS
jgi:hypothetical protein